MSRFSFTFQEHFYNLKEIKLESLWWSIAIAYLDSGGCYMFAIRSNVQGSVRHHTEVPYKNVVATGSLHHTRHDKTPNHPN